MNSKRGCFSAIYHEGCIFVFGGINYTDRILTKCERYDIVSNQWHNIAPMSKSRKNSSAVALNSESLYVFGGVSTFRALDSIEKYSIMLNTWTELPITLPNPLSFPVTFKISNSKILILGGMVKERSSLGTSYRSN